MKTNELTGAALDWAVSMIVENSRPFPIWLDGKPQSYAAYSTDWAHGGPIIERERIEVRYRVGVNMTATIDGQHEQSVPYRQPNAQLTVAMRCYVASKLGDEVEIPTELQGESK